MYKKILLPVDGSNINQKAVKSALEISKCFNGQIILLNVIQMNMPQSNNLEYSLHCSVACCEHINELKSLSTELLDKTSKIFELENINVLKISKVGNPSEEILSCAKEHNCDLIVMATSSVSGLKRYLIGSTTSNVIHHSKFPVLMIP